MTHSNKPARIRRFTPKVKTGCYNCRRRHLKCPEQLPSCKRCEIAYLDCQYPSNAIGHALAPLAPQPSAMMFPSGVAPSRADLESFGVFCSSTVKVASGPFHQRFWQIDVPRAAVLYPTMWHASVALAGVSLSCANEIPEAQADSKKSHHAPRNAQYVNALVHFNKSIQHLSRSLATYDDGAATYGQKEMAIMTNLLYIGIASILDDERQMTSHCNNLLSLVKSLRFGEDNVDPSQGIMPYDELLCLVLAVDGSTADKADITPRSDRAWKVKVPLYSSFTSISQANAAFLPFAYQELQDAEMLPGAGAQGLSWPILVSQLNNFEEFERKLIEFQQSGGHDSKYKGASIEILMQHASLLKIHSQSLVRARSRVELLRYDQKYIPALGRFERLLSRPCNARAPFALKKPHLYSLSHGSLLLHVVAYSHNATTRRRGIEMMQKWPFKENGMHSDDTARMYEIFIQHELAGPERTRASQLAGSAVIPAYENGGLQDGRVFDGTQECECLSGLFVCRDHKVTEYEMDASSSGRHSLQLRSWYEYRNNMPRTRYYLDEVDFERGCRLPEARDYIGRLAAVSVTA